MKKVVYAIAGLLALIVYQNCSELSTSSSPTQNDESSPLGLSPTGDPINPKLEDLSGAGLVYYYLGGKRGLILCFHGTGGSAQGWANDNDDKQAFLIEMAQLGYSFVCPTSGNRTSRQWNNTNDNTNSDVTMIDNLLQRQNLDTSTPIILVGHSNGGGFTSRYFAFSNFSAQVVAIQLSNASGIAPILRHPDYDVPTLFNYADCDPIVNANSVRANQQVLAGKNPPVTFIDNDLDDTYNGGSYENCHKFVNTSDRVLDLIQ